MNAKFGTAVPWLIDCSGIIPGFNFTTSCLTIGEARSFAGRDGPDHCTYQTKTNARSSTWLQTQLIPSNQATNQHWLYCWTIINMKKQLYCVSVRIYKWMYNDFRQDRVCQLLNQRRRSRFMSSDWLTRDEGDKAAKSLSTISLMAPKWNRQSPQEPLALAQPTPLVDSKKNSAPLRSAMPLSHIEGEMTRAHARRVASFSSKEKADRSCRQAIQDSWL
jgi:hypothetical protein